jgi:hypothetical protein
MARSHLLTPPSIVGTRALRNKAREAPRLSFVVSTRPLPDMIARRPPPPFLRRQAFSPRLRGGAPAPRSGAYGARTQAAKRLRFVLRYGSNDLSEPEQSRLKGVFRVERARGRGHNKRR